MHFQCILVISLSLVLIETQNVEKMANTKIVGPQNYTVFQRGLCVKEINKNYILNNYKSYYGFTNDTRIMTEVLGFLETPNEDSIKEATTFAYKFSMLSPFRLEIKRTGLERYKISGMSAIKKTHKWLNNLMNTNDKYINIVPLVTFTNFKEADFLALTISYKEIINLSLELLTACEKYGLDGLILDIWSEFYGKLPTSMLVMIIQEISARLRFDYKFALLLIPPMYANKDVINKEIFENLADYVNYIILQVYDYSWSPGPNSPVLLVEDLIKYLTPDPLVRRDAIMIGVNFFGTVHTTSGTIKIFKNQYINFLEIYDIDFQFDKESLEHYFEISTTVGKQLIYYPTLYSLHSRVRLANKLGIRLAISELGQGLEYFYDVL